MTPYYDEDGVTIYHGDAMEILPTLAAGSVTAVVTDPPYVIGAVSAGNMASTRRIAARARPPRLRGDGMTSTIPVSLPDGSTASEPTYKWPSTTGSTDDR